MCQLGTPGGVSSPPVSHRATAAQPAGMVTRAAEMAAAAARATALAMEMVDGGAVVTGDVVGVSVGMGAIAWVVDGGDAADVRVVVSWGRCVPPDRSAESDDGKLAMTACVVGTFWPRRLAALIVCGPGVLRCQDASPRHAVCGDACDDQLTDQQHTPRAVMHSMAAVLDHCLGTLAPPPVLERCGGSRLRILTRVCDRQSTVCFVADTHMFIPSLPGAACGS